VGAPGAVGAALVGDDEVPVGTGGRDEPAGGNVVVVRVGAGAVVAGGAVAGGVVGGAVLGGTVGGGGASDAGDTAGGPPAPNAHPSVLPTGGR